MAETHFENRILEDRGRSAKIALLLPCLNEELTLKKVIRDFRSVLPQLQVYLFDNGSTDGSVAIALEEGVTVIQVEKRGKGHVVRKMFERVDADIYVMVDSDDTYDSTRLPELIVPILRGEAEMVVASRLEDHSTNAFRKFHRLGNVIIQKLINLIFRNHLSDICSGYRVMSRNFVENIPLLSDGFEVETELTVYSLMYGLPILELPLPYRERPPNSTSKLKTFKDGYKVLLTIVWLARDLRPLLFFAACATLIFVLGVLPLLYWQPQRIFWLLSLTFLSICLLMTGLILNTLSVKFSELQSLQRRKSIPKIKPFETRRAA